MHCLSPKMVCETKIVAEDHDSISGAKKESLLVSSSAQMWPSSRAGSGSPAAGPQLQPQPPPPSPAPDGEDQKKGVCIREFHPSEQEAVRRIFYEGIMERIPNTAFRGLKDQPWTQMVYGTMAVMCFVVTKSLLLTCCLPFFLMGMRYYFSRKVILSYLECALNTDMSDIEQYYMKSPEVISTDGGENTPQTAAMVMASTHRGPFTSHDLLDPSDIRQASISFQLVEKKSSHSTFQCWLLEPRSSQNGNSRTSTVPQVTCNQTLTSQAQDVKSSENQRPWGTGEIKNHPHAHAEPSTPTEPAFLEGDLQDVTENILRTILQKKAMHICTVYVPEPPPTPFLSFKVSSSYY
ncbi:Hypothetical predicted protein [Podarcis lilfordi]|uniref:Uncharacterized protein n=1 Tax=Podarcis lilfordi TaxID=74358 RepID=A0AA35P6M2_9SAUR|nr:Hypothetical predicted protein [Podarcis lilfordi]